MSTPTPSRDTGSAEDTPGARLGATCALTSAHVFPGFPSVLPRLLPSVYDRRPRGHRGREPHALWHLPALAPPWRVGGGVPGRSDACHPHGLRALHAAGR